jgi:hypothetical protein
MKKITFFCDLCGEEIKSKGRHYSLPEYVEVTVTERTNGPVPAVLGWSNTDTYHFCLKCERDRGFIKRMLLGTKE